MEWNFVLLLGAVIFLVLALSWFNSRRTIPAKSEPLVYLQGRNQMNNPDSDSDMQEQYDYRKRTNK
ncbi:hypothetical protein [Ammoniphilus sp. YIM 78166]|uniref:hypothetical protein n=1 Tax=Ammoniphilus sp. YIM 78166 TaxID=1644106 RepID=UPI00106F3E30|nr:hypothetical protein [Ammoniphilus sp. YIM 78166]